MSHFSKVSAAHRVLLLLAVSGGALGHPGLRLLRHTARPATSYSYFRMSVPAAHTAPAAPVYAAHPPLAALAHGPEDDADLEDHGGYHQEPIAHPKYEFKYGVEDPHTGDHKHQREERDGDLVKGEYSLLQPDGRKRTVHYTASKHGGFNAIVSYSGHAIHPEVHELAPAYGHDGLF